ncbi:hypothetical protein FFWV33_02550 [Flavobacterium faecale]|uniref:Lipocalin-like domain-containing protein n=1 Tax=Flavobacterium faecale TaxID=1355330 RepID=A0A2S1LAB2_9FLAO|nr:DUF6252 family protein [Flavobacterium faecale]AWG20486.1 hypothetical protein FFWV33_02550 [Flavobacterium faecale]
MKKIFLLIVISLAFISCEENVQFNNPSFQGLKDNVFWRSITTTATVNASSELTITAYTTKEKIILQTPNTALTTYFLGEDDFNTASYQIDEEPNTTLYTTGTDIGNGQITITEYDVLNKTISGTFRFNTVNTLTEATVNFQQGVFYKVPVTP